MKDNEAKAFLLELCPRIGESAPELARRCGCLPLALRIAGSFLALNADWSLPEYLERLQARRLQTLRSADDAELDLETVFDESYQSLREEERQKWRTLAVFPASFDRPAAAAVWHLDDPSAHDLLSRFCRYSLLDFLPSPLPPLPKSGEGPGVRADTPSTTCWPNLAAPAATEKNRMRHICPLYATLCKFWKAQTNFTCAGAKAFYTACDCWILNGLTSWPRKPGHPNILKNREKSLVSTVK